MRRRQPCRQQGFWLRCPWLLLLLQCHVSLCFKKPAQQRATLVFNETAASSQTSRQLSLDENINRRELSSSLGRTVTSVEVESPSPSKPTPNAANSSPTASETGPKPPVAKNTDSSGQDIAAPARLLILLRAYERRYGIPHNTGGPAIQRQVLRDMTRHLYSSGAPSWVLETVMEHVAAGMLLVRQQEAVQFFVLPNRCFVMYPNNNNNDNNNVPPATDLFPIQAGYDMARLGKVEPLAIRMALFAARAKERDESFSTDSAGDKDWLLMQKQAAESYLARVNPTAEQLVQEIFSVASLTSNRVLLSSEDMARLDDNATTKQTKNEDGLAASFWTVSDSTREVWTRLVAHEAAQSLSRMTERQHRPLYPRGSVGVFRMVATAGACGMWFQGSWSDMGVTAILASSVSLVDKAIANREKRLLTEVVASLCVGLVAGLLALTWPDRFSFGSIAVSAILDFLQGYKIVYAVIEIMSRNMVAGTARLMEGMLFTGLISHALMFGFDLACRLTKNPFDYAHMLHTSHGINKGWFPLLLPLSAVAWSGLFRPTPTDLPLMAFHGMLSFGLTQWAGAPLFVAAMLVTLSAGLVSHITGREALGNTVAGLYALVPGCSAVQVLLSLDHANFLERVLVAAAKIGLGAWTGTILGSPIILGQMSGWRHSEGKRPQTMFCF